MPNIINWGILGTGNMATNFARDLATRDDARLAAVGSRSVESAEKFGHTVGAERFYGSYQALAADPAIDIVYIATPHTLHRDNSLMCLEAGKAVLCEKPFAINAAEATAVINCATANKLFLMEAMWTRFLPAMYKLRQFVEEGRIGRITMVRAGGGFMPAYDPNHYLFDVNRGGGVLLDAGVYLVHLAAMLLGAPDKVCALGQVGAYGVDDSIGIMLGYGKGTIASLHLSLHHQEPPEATIFGERGRIGIHAPVFAPSAITLTPYDGTPETFSFSNDGGYAFQAGEAGRCLRQGLVQSPLMSWQATLDVMNIMDEARCQIGMIYPVEQAS